jgi:hypothetical protein
MKNTETQEEKVRIVIELSQDNVKKLHIEGVRKGMKRKAYLETILIEKAKTLKA